MYHHLKLLPAHLTQYSQLQLGVQLLQQRNAPDPQWISYIYIYAYPHACLHIYISLLVFWGRAVGQGETESWPPCPMVPLGVRFSLCSALPPESSSPTQNTAMHSKSKMSTMRTQNMVGTHPSVYAGYIKGRLGLPIAHSCLSGPFRSLSLTSCMRVQDLL